MNKVVKGIANAIYMGNPRKVEENVTRKWLLSYMNEFKILEEVVCSACKENYADKHNTVSSRPRGRAKIPILPANISRRVAWLLAISMRHMKINPPGFSLSESKIWSGMTQPNIPIFVAQRCCFTDAKLKVSFVHSFSHRTEVLSQVSSAISGVLSEVPLVRSVCFSPDGRYLAVGLGRGAESRVPDSGSVVIYEVETRNRICELTEYASKYPSSRRPAVDCLGFSPDGRYLVVGDEVRLIVWDLPNKRVRNIFQNAESISFSPNGRLLAFTSNATVVTTNMRDDSRRVFYSTGICSGGIRFSPDGKHIAAGDYDGSLRLWDVRSGRLVKKWEPPYRLQTSIIFAPDGKGLLSVTDDGAAKYWDVRFLSKGIRYEEPGRVTLIRKLEGPGLIKDRVRAAISPDGRLIGVTSAVGFSILSDVISGTPQYALTGHKTCNTSIDFSPAGTYFAVGGEDNRVSLWKYTWIDDRHQVQKSGTCRKRKRSFSEV